MKIKQFVMAYEVDQDRLRACIPDGFQSLRPVLRINAEIRDTNPETAYIEFNTAIEGYGKRGWLNIGHWDSKSSELSYHCTGNTTVFALPFLSISFTSVEIKGGCPAERDNQGCFFIDEATVLRSSESIQSDKEFCDCEFAWQLPEGGAHGISTGKTLPAHFTESQKQYARRPFSVNSLATIPCKQVLGAYQVIFGRTNLQMEETIINTSTLNDGSK